MNTRTTTLDLDISKLPQKLETAEDYENVILNFILPFLQTQAVRTAEVLEELALDLEKEELSQERLQMYVNRLRALNAFANPDGAMYPYFYSIAELEDRLEREGYFS